MRCALRRGVASALAVQAGHHRQVLATRHHLFHGGRLPGQPDAPPDFHRVAHDVVSVHPQRPGVGLDERGHHADERGLARSVRAQDRHGLTRRKGQREVRQRPDLPEPLRDSLGLNQRLHMSSPPISFCRLSRALVDSRPVDSRPVDSRPVDSRPVDSRSDVRRRHVSSVTAAPRRRFSSLPRQLEREVFGGGVELPRVEGAPHVEALEGA